MAADLDLVRRLAAADHGLAVVAVVRADGTVQSSLVNAGVLGQARRHGRRPRSRPPPRCRRPRPRRRRGRAAITFRSGWEWVAVEGPVTLVGVDDAVAGVGAGGVPQLLRDVFTAAGGTHEDWAEFDRVMAEEGRLAVFVTPARVTSN